MVDLGKAFTTYSAIADQKGTIGSIGMDLSLDTFQSAMQSVNKDNVGFLNINDFRIVISALGFDEADFYPLFALMGGSVNDPNSNVKISTIIDYARHYAGKNGKMTSLDWGEFTDMLTGKPPPISQMRINIVWGDSVKNAPIWFKVEVEKAAQEVAKKFKDDVTINISVDYGGVQTNDTFTEIDKYSGGAYLNNFKGYNYGDIINMLSNDAKSTDDYSVINSLNNKVQDPNGTGKISVASAQAKAMGLINSNDVKIDGAIGIGTGVSFYSIKGLLIHEITHAMGRTSGSPSTIDGNPFGAGIQDLIRYSAPHTNHYDGRVAGDYFSLDDGVTPLAYYDSTSDFGDFNLPQPGMVGRYDDAFNATSVGDEFTNVGLRNMDVIGFDLIENIK